MPPSRSGRAGVRRADRSSDAGRAARARSKGPSPRRLPRRSFCHAPRRPSTRFSAPQGERPRPGPSGTGRPMTTASRLPTPLHEGVPPLPQAVHCDRVAARAPRCIDPSPAGAAGRDGPRRGRPPLLSRPTSGRAAASSSASNGLSSAMVRPWARRARPPRPRLPGRGVGPAGKSGAVSGHPNTIGPTSVTSATISTNPARSSAKPYFTIWPIGT